MKKIPVVIASVVALFSIGQASASGIVHEANEARAQAYELNHEASEKEAAVRYALRHGYNPIHLRKQAAAMRRAATSLAWESNRLAKAYYSGRHY